MNEETSFKVSEQMTKFRVGDRITWTSRTAEKRTGEILAVLLAGRSAREAVRRVHKSVPRSHIMVCDKTHTDRYLVRVDTGKALLFYAPLVKTIDGASTARGRKVRS